MVKASATMRWVRRGTSLMTPAATHYITNKVMADINVTGELATNRIFRHGDTGQIIFIDMCRSSLSIAKVTKDLAHVIL